MPTYKSVTLAAGESYILPPGATIISLSNPDIYSSENNCAPKDNVETLGCYSIQIQESVSNGGDAAYNDIIVTGVKIGETFYSFSSPINFSNCNGCIPTTTISDFKNRLTQVGLGDLFFDWSGYADVIPNSGDAAMVTMLCFKTVPSVGSILSFTAYGHQDGTAPNVPIIIPVLLSSVMLTQYLGGGGYDDFVNACSCQATT